MTWQDLRYACACSGVRSRFTFVSMLTLALGLEIGSRKDLGADRAQIAVDCGFGVTPHKLVTGTALAARLLAMAVAAALAVGSLSHAVSPAVCWRF